MKGLFTFILILFTFNNLFSQSYSYSYVDPCTGKVKSLTIPSGQNTITVNYYGTVSQFSGNDFNNGVFSAWINSVAAANSSQPCGEVVTQLTGNVNMIVTQNIVSTVMNVTSIANMAQSMSAMSSMSSGLGNSVNNSESGGNGGSDGSKKDKNNGKNGGGNNSNGSSSNNSSNSSGNTNNTTGNQTQGQGTQIGSNNGTSSQSTGSNGNPSGNSSSANGNGNNSGSSNGNGQTNPSGSGQTSGGSVNPGSGNSSNPSSSGNNPSGGSNGSANSGSGTSQPNTSQGSNSTSGSSTSPGSNPSSTGGSTSNNNSGGSGSTGSGTSTGGTGTGGSGTGTNGTQTTPGSQENTNTAKSGGGSTGGISNSVSNSEDNSGNGGSKSGGSRTRTGSLIGSGDVVALKSAEDPGANNQFKFTASLTHANTKNTKVSGLLGNYTTEIRNLNLTLYKAWVIPESQWTIIAANSSMLNFERDFFNTTTTLASKRFKGDWKKLTVMGGLNYTWGNLGETKFGNLSAVGGGFYSYNLGKKVSGSILCLAVYSPFTQFFEGQWWQSGTLLVPFNSWDYSITKTFKFNISVSGVYEVNRNFLNYQVLTGGKILL